MTSHCLVVGAPGYTSGAAAYTGGAAAFICATAKKYYPVPAELKLGLRKRKKG